MKRRRRFLPDHKGRGILAKNIMKGANPDRWLAPAEAFARAGEICLRLRLGADNSLLAPEEHYRTDWAYAPYRDRWDEIGAVFDRLFA